MINWIIRYAKILDENRELFDPAKSVLEIGSGAQGIAQYLKRKVTGLEPVFSGPVNQWLEPAQGSIFEIPFPDASFDYVICVDVLEHLTEPKRKQAITELLRCARQKVIISCPCGLAALAGETRLAGFFKNFFIPIPNWLTEHFQNGIPTVASILSALADTGKRFEISGNETITQHYGGIILDYVFPMADELKTDLLSKTSVMAPLSGAEWDQFYSFLFSIHAGFEQRPHLNLDYRGGRQAGGMAELYSVYHKPWQTGHLGRVKPVFSGAAAAAAPPGALTDILAGEPRLLNSRWSELSAIYKIWKEGPRSDIIGFCHYRRLFNFAALPGAPRETKVTEAQLLLHTESFFDQNRLTALGGQEILCAPALFDEVSIWDSFILAHNTQDYCRLVTIIAAICPQLMPFIIEQHSVKGLYANNMFAMSWIFFDELCSLWFHVLREFERNVPAGRGNEYQNRDISFLSERIFDAWIRYKKSLGVTIVEVPIFFVP